MRKNIFITSFLLSSFTLLSFLSAHAATNPLYFCTSADSTFFDSAIDLIASIHKFHFNELQEIAVFDLGFTEEQRNYLNTIRKVHVYNIEMTHPDLLTHFKIRSDGRTARGWYAWKPVAMKQASEMFPYFLYVDAGITVVGKLNIIFDYIKENGYFMIDCNHSIRQMATTHVIKKFDLTSPEQSWILDSFGLSAGFMGVSREVYDTLILPMYQLTKDLYLFEDNGTCPKGFGWARHDQALFSIHARLLGLTIIDGMIAGKTRQLLIGGKTTPFRLCSHVIIPRFKIDAKMIKKNLRLIKK